MLAFRHRCPRVAVPETLALTARWTHLSVCSGQAGLLQNLAPEPLFGDLERGEFLVHYGKIDPAVTWMKLAALKEGAERASRVAA